MHKGIRNTFLAIGITFGLVIAACGAHNDSVSKHDVQVKVDKARVALTGYCAKQGLDPWAWSEVDANGDVGVYGRCVKHDGDIERGA